MTTTAAQIINSRDAEIACVSAALVYNSLHCVVSVKPWLSCGSAMTRYECRTVTHSFTSLGWTRLFHAVQLHVARCIELIKMSCFCQ